MDPIALIRRAVALARRSLGTLGDALVHLAAQGVALPLNAPRFAQALRHTDHLVVITDAQRRITWVNPAFERISGHRLGDCIGRSPGALVQCAATDAFTVQRMREALAAGRPFSGEVLNCARSGRMYWLELDIQPLHDRRGRLTGFASIQNDITERKLGESALRASESFLNSAGYIAGVGGWAFDLRSHALTCTPQSASILGLPYGQLQAEVGDCLAQFPPEARVQLEAAIARAQASTDLRTGIDGTARWDFELPMRARDGRELWVRLVAEAQYDDSGPVRVVGALQDVTERRSMAAEARRNAELLRGAIDTIDEAFVVYDADERLVYCNDKYREVYATSADLLVPGSHFEDIIRIGAARGQYAAATGRVDDWVSERLARHRSGNSTLVQRLDDGRVVRIVERRTADGHTVGFRIDITDLVRATEAAEAANRAKTEFIGTISHELRTPLQSVIGFSALGRRFAAHDARLKPMFDDIHAGGQRMLRLVNALLDVSKVDGTVGSLARKRCDLIALCAEVAHELRPIAESRQITIRLPEQASPQPVEGDPFRLQQVLRNVLANALRFSPEGGSVELAVDERDPQGLALTVRDHGPGIPPQELESIFDAFVQSSRTRDGSGGTGLGLTISRKIMRAHGGRISAANAPGGGALMCLWLPRIAAPADAAAPSPPMAVEPTP